jgi:hypothetical protein
LASIGFKFNVDGLCIANRKVKIAAHIIKFHVDDLKWSRTDPKVKDISFPG